jgi:hypothetical protein
MVHRDYHLDCGILSFPENGRLVNYLELSGMSIDWSMQFPLSTRVESIKC